MCIRDRSNGERYEGEFLEDYLTGEGTMTYLDDSRYVGNFKNNFRNGYGELTSKLGGTFKGFYRNDQRHGYGIRLTIEDEVVLERWLNGVLNDSSFLDIKEECEALHEGRKWLVSAENCVNGFAHGHSAMVDSELRVLVPNAFLVLGRLVEGEVLYLRSSRGYEIE